MRGDGRRTEKLFSYTEHGARLVPDGPSAAARS